MQSWLAINYRRVHLPSSELSGPRDLDDGTSRCPETWVTNYQLTLTNIAEHGGILKSRSSSASPQIPWTLRTPEVNDHMHRSSPRVSILSHMNPVHAIPLHFLKICFNIIVPPTPRSYKQSLSSTLSHQNTVCIYSPHNTCHMTRQSHASWADNQKNILVSTTNFEASRHVVFWSFPLRTPT